MIYRLYGNDELPEPNDNDYPLFHAQWLDDIGDDRIRHIDMVNANFDSEEVDNFGLSSVSRVEQALILGTIEMNLYPIKNASKHSPSSYAIKHAVEDYLGFYVSDLQARTCLVIAGYKGTGDDYPRFNVSMKAWRRFKNASLDRYHNGTAKTA